MVGMEEGIGEGFITPRLDGRETGSMPPIRRQVDGSRLTPFPAAVGNGELAVAPLPLNIFLWPSSGVSMTS